jgi:hypothetical protein
MNKNFKLFIFLFLSMLSIYWLFPADFSAVDDLYKNGMYEDGLKKLKENFNKDNPDPAVIWRMSRMIYEIADAMPMKNKKDKILKFTEGMDTVKPFLEFTAGNNEDIAQMIFWFDANFGARGETIGIKESLDIIPELFKYADKALSFDPKYAAAYLMKGRIDDAVPAFLGGDKFRLGINFSKAIKYNSKDMNVLVDAAKAFFNRNWDKDKKSSMATKKSMTDETPQDLSDREYAKNLLNQAVNLFKSFDKPSVRDKSKYDQAISLLKRLK